MKYRLDVDNKWDSSKTAKSSEDAIKQVFPNAKSIKFDGSDNEDGEYFSEYSVVDNKGTRHQVKVYEESVEKNMSLEKIVEKVLNEENTKKVDAKTIAKVLWSSDFEMKDRVWLSGDTLEIADSFYYEGDRTLKNLIKAWTDPNGTYASYFGQEYGVVFELVNKAEHFNTSGKYKKFAGKMGGVVVIFVKVKTLDEIEGEN